MIPPLNSNNTDQDFEMFDSIETTYNNGSAEKQIDALSNPTSSISVKPTPPADASAILELRTIPPNASQPLVDLYIRFSFDYTVPSGTVITIAPPAIA
jgi:hypothetical protein